nr:TerB family tellurite resistance protein [uncultured Prevotella sp.]
MTKEELYLKTVFCCIACDGDIATEEVDLVKDLCAKDNIFCNMDSEILLNSWIAEINERGGLFLQSYLEEIKSVELNVKEQLLLVSLAIKAIEADNRIEYSEVKFFKKIRSRLTISDEAILAEHPDKEDFLLPDINITELPQWDNNILFSQISISARIN